MVKLPLSSEMAPVCKSAMNTETPASGVFLESLIVPVNVCCAIAPVENRMNKMYMIFFIWVLIEMYDNQLRMSENKYNGKKIFNLQSGNAESFVRRDKESITRNICSN